MTETSTACAHRPSPDLDEDPPVAAGTAVATVHGTSPKKVDMAKDDSGKSTPEKATLRDIAEGARKDRMDFSGTESGSDSQRESEMPVKLTKQQSMVSLRSAVEISLIGDNGIFRFFHQTNFW